MADTNSAQRAVPPGLGPASRSNLLFLWTAALAWTAWWTWEIWATGALYVVGPVFMFAVWLLPTLPLFVVTLFRLRATRRAVRFGPLAAVVTAAVLIVVVPFRLPRVHFDASGSGTTIPASLYVFMATLTLIPAASVLTSLVAVAWVRPRRATLEVAMRDESIER